MRRSSSEGYDVASFVGLVPVWERGKGKEDGHQVIGCIPTASMFRGQHSERKSLQPEDRKRSTVAKVADGAVLGAPAGGGRGAISSVQAAVGLLVATKESEAPTTRPSGRSAGFLGIVL